MYLSMGLVYEDKKSIMYFFHLDFTSYLVIYIVILRKGGERAGRTEKFKNLGTHSVPRTTRRTYMKSHGWNQSQ